MKQPDTEPDLAAIASDWSFPTRVRFGAGRIAELASACRDTGMRRPLLVTDPGLAALPMIPAAVAALEADGLECALFAQVHGNPTGADVDAGVAVYRDGGHDGVIAFGGGSALDVGKAIAFAAGQSRPLWDFEDREDWWTRADAGRIAPVVAVPTTAGTGSEVGRASVITDERDHTKKIIFHPRMLPAVVISDPELTVGLPAPITAAVGMDALSHNLEALCSPVFHPMAEGIALEGIRLVDAHLARACEDGADLGARAGMLAAASMGATAFQKGLGAMHSLSHPCSSLFGTHHGLTNAVVMPYVLAFNRPAVAGKLARLARLLGLERADADGFMEWVLALRRRIRIPHTLAEIGVEAGAVERMAAMALVDPPSATNPVALSEASLADLYRKALAGDL